MGAGRVLQPCGFLELGVLGRASPAQAHVDLDDDAKTQGISAST